MALMGKVVLGVLVIAMFLGNIGVGPTMAFTLCGMTDEGIEACRPSIRTDDPVDPSTPMQRCRSRPSVISHLPSARNGTRM
ncbi:hypothetical protein MRB53_027724 [Persea americana]|uniref:Uncharacterized protein n=1 Tax=Persea americana TaxID=3435 RepID=A0ACC2LLX6_PERAE|nr:hypothetical protein MRB53_027724 [Persea americana]